MYIDDTVKCKYLCPAGNVFASVNLFVYLLVHD